MEDDDDDEEEEELGVEERTRFRVCADPGTDRAYSITAFHCRPAIKSKMTLEEDDGDACILEVVVAVAVVVAVLVLLLEVGVVGVETVVDGVAAVTFLKGDDC